MDWPKIPLSSLIDKLTPPTGRVDLVLDTDTYNEVDDQFALCYALRSPERVTVQAIYAAPYFNDRSTGPEDGMEKSYAEILRLLDKMGERERYPVYEGSRRYLPDGETFVESPAARDLVRRGMERSDDDPLYVVAIGAITNVASALLMEPRLVRKLHVVWLGGTPLTFPSAREFNLMQDVPAARVVFDCGCPVTLMPALGVSSHMLATAPDVRAYLGGKNAVCDALVELFCAYTDNEFGWAKEIWDVAAVALLVKPECVWSTLEPSPLLSDDCRWSRDANRHFIRVATFIQRTPVFRDLYTKLANG